MKKRIILTLAIAGLYLSLVGIWNALRSPAAGAASAATLDDTLQSWVVATAVRSDFVDHLIMAACVALIIVVWLVGAKTKKT